MYRTTPPSRQTQPQQIITNIKSTNRHDIVQTSSFFLGTCRNEDSESYQNLLESIKFLHGNEPVVQRALESACVCQTFKKTTKHGKKMKVLIDSLPGIVPKTFKNLLANVQLQQCRCYFDINQQPSLKKKKKSHKNTRQLQSPYIYFVIICMSAFNNK